MTRKRIYWTLFVLLNLAFIPLMSLYGLRVCPILNMGGFLAGCSYSSSFVALVLILNFALLRFFAGSALLRSRPLPVYAGIYLASTLLALAVQLAVFRMQHISTMSRAPEVMLLASLLLGLAQMYGLNWVDAASRRPAAGGEATLRSRWVGHVWRALLPMGAALLVLAHFLLRQSAGINRGHVAPSQGVDGLIYASLLLLAFLFAWLGVTYFFHFIEEKMHADSVEAHLEELGDFNFSYRSAPDSAWGLWSEILGRLNSFSQALGERSSLLNSFSRFVGRDVASSALSGEIKEAAGRERELAILMSDIRNFTSLSEKMPPADVAAMLNAYFSAMLEELKAYGLAADKFVGDGILAYASGAVPGLAAQAGAAVDASLAMLRRLERLNVELRAKGWPELAIGIGIEAGPVSLGLIGSAEKLQYTAIGEVVNKASRLEGLCKELGVRLVVSAPVMSLLDQRRAALFRGYGKRRLKGVAEPVEVFGLSEPVRAEGTLIAK